MVSPISKSLLFIACYPGRLNPFSVLDKYYQIDETTSLKVLEELKFNNGFFSDILKVEVTGGYYRGVVGYLFENQVVLQYNRLNEYPDIVFTADYRANGLSIKKGEIFSIYDTVFDPERGEVLKVNLDKSVEGGRVFELSDKSLYRFVINRQADVNYFSESGGSAIMIADVGSFISIEGFKTAAGLLTDKEGYLLVDNGDTVTLTKDGYSPVYHHGDGLSLYFVAELDYISYLSDASTKRSGLSKSFQINTKNYGVMNRLGYSFLEDTKLDLLCLPSFDSSLGNVIDGFYIDNLQDGVSGELAFKTSHSFASGYQAYQVYQYDQSINRWIKKESINGSGQITTILHSGGYYALVSEFGQKTMSQTGKLRISHSDAYNDAYSQVYLLGSEGGVFSVDRSTISGGMTYIELPIGEYQVFCIVSDDPLNIKSQLVKIGSGETNIAFEYSKDFLGDRPGFSKYYYGRWKMHSFKKNNKIVKPGNEFEALGDLDILGENILRFSGQNCLVTARFHRTGKDMGLIVIRRSSLPVYLQSMKTFHKISPSLYDSELVIPVIVTHFVGVLQISFDAVYFSRRKLLDDEYSQNTPVLSGFPFGEQKYPETEEKALFKIFYTK